MPQIGQSDIDRFLRFVSEEGDCWIWTGSLLASGKPQFWHNNKNHAAHNVAYENWNGHIPHGHVVYQTCQNWRCVRPSHLKTKKRGFWSRGQKWTRKLTPDQARYIKLNPDNLPAPALAQKMQTEIHNIYLIQKNRTWKEIK